MLTVARGSYAYGVASFPDVKFVTRFADHGVYDVRGVAGYCRVAPRLFPIVECVVRSFDDFCT